MSVLLKMAFSLLVLFFTTQAFAQQEECTREYLDSVNAKCDSAESTMRILDRNIASVAGSQSREGINDGANAQMSGLKAELDTFPTIAEGCEAIAKDCMRVCAKHEGVCDKPKLQAASMAIQIGSMNRAFAETQAVDKASEVQTAQTVPVAPAWVHNCCKEYHPFASPAYNNCVFQMGQGLCKGPGDFGPSRREMRR